MIDLSAAGARAAPSVIPENTLHFVDPASPFAVGSQTTLPSIRDEGPYDSVHSGSSRDAATFAPGFLKTARHPMICVFHLIFKAAALTTFLFGSFLFGGWEGDYVFSFVTTTAFLSIDFWTVKNITGRFLVGMRWWNSIKDDGSSEWIYEAHTDERVINSTDKTVFWAGLYIWPACWIIFLFVFILRLEIEWVLLILIGLALSGANLVGYWNCSKEPQKNVERWATTTALKALVGSFF